MTLRGTALHNSIMFSQRIILDARQQKHIQKDKSPMKQQVNIIWCAFFSTLFPTPTKHSPAAFISDSVHACPHKIKVMRWASGCRQKKIWVCLSGRLQNRTNSLTCSSSSWVTPYTSLISRFMKKDTSNNSGEWGKCSALQPPGRHSLTGRLNGYDTDTLYLRFCKTV